MRLERRFQHSPLLIADSGPFQVFEARDGMGRQARLRGMLDVARLRRRAAALLVDEQLPLQAAIAHVKDTAPVAIAAASGSITHTGATVGSALFVFVCAGASITSVVDTTTSVAATLLKAQACTDSPTSSGAIYVLTNVAAGSHVITLTMGSSSNAAIWVSEFSGMYSCTLDKSNGNGANSSGSKSAGATGTMTTQPELALLLCQNIHSGYTATTLPTQGGTWTSIATNGFLGNSGFASCYLATTATTTITPAYAGDASAYESANVIVTMIPGSAPSAPTISSPTATSSAPTTVLGGVTTDTASGTLYAVVDSAANLASITAAEIIAGTKHGGGAAVGSANAAVTTTTPSVTVSGLTGSTLYTIAFVQVGSGGNSNVSTTTFTSHAPIPTISGVTPNPATDGSSATIAGTTFLSSKGSGEADLAGTAQTTTAWADTSITETVAIGANKYGATVAQTVKNNNGDTSAAFNITINPPAGTSYVNIGTPDATAANRITTSGGGDLVSGDQVAWRNVVGTGSVTVNADGTFVADPGVASFDFACWTAGSGWGSFGTQTLLSTASGAAAVAAWFGL